MEAIKLCRLDTPIIFIEARINLSRFVVTGCAAKTDRKSGSAGMPRPISYAVFCLKKKKRDTVGQKQKRIADSHDIHQKQVVGAGHLRTHRSAVKLRCRVV